MEFQRSVNLKALTTFRIGGPAQLYANPSTEEELVSALEFAAREDLRVRILGRGSNLLVADEGVSGLVLDTRRMSGTLIRKDHQIIAGAGVFLPKFSRFVANMGYTGYEFYIGIPGTVGGAVVMNAGYGPGDERQTAARCERVRAWNPDKGVVEYPYKFWNPSYRRTSFMDTREVVLSAAFDLGEPAPASQIREETARQLAMRKRMQPLTRPTAGSIFAATDEGIPAAVLVDQAGLKGVQVGGARVSPKHANWIENVGGATASDVITLIALIQKEIQSRFGVLLREELVRWC